MVSREQVDAAVARSPHSCNGDRGCTCCAPGCDCGCRDDCPRFRQDISLGIAAAQSQDVLFACCHGEQRCHECPDTKCGDNEQRAAKEAAGGE